MLVASELANSLENDWLVAQGGSYPDSTILSGYRFSVVVSQWFANAMAATFPCATAAVRQTQLAATAAAALEAGIPQASAQLLALAVAGYMAGQAFGAGFATFPTALPAGVASFTQALATLDLTHGARATLLAQGCHVMAVSTVVVFPPVIMPPSPIF